MPSAKRVLGRGLADLIPVGGGEAEPAGGAPAQEAPIASLHPNPHQPRTHFDESALAELAESIRSNGILQPILVRPRTTGGFEIVAGERRYRAALRAGLTQVPIVVRELTDAETLALALIENLIREDIGPLESAKAFKRLMEDFQWTQEEMSRRVGKSRTAVTNALRLLQLPTAIQESLERGQITEGHARALLSGDSPERQQRVWRRIQKQGISVRETERLMRPTSADASALPRRAARTHARTTPDNDALEERLRRALGTKVQLVGTEQQGKIVIEFFSRDELDGLISRLESDVTPADATSPVRRTTRSPIEGLLSSRPLR